MSFTSNLLDQINNYKEDFYTKNPKNVIFKKKQKLDCAKEICQKFQLSELLDKTFYIIPNTNHLYFDYMVFKLYANEFNYESIIVHTLNVINNCVKMYDSLNVHIDLHTFTVSAGERYYKFVEMYINHCLIGSNTREYFISEKLERLYLYNPPSVMDLLHKMFKSKIEHIKDKIKIIPKTESKAALSQLLSIMPYNRLLGGTGGGDGYGEEEEVGENV